MRKRRTGWRDLAQVACLTALLFVLVESFAVQGYRVYGGCMEPNLSTGERLLSLRCYYRFRAPARGDVIVFRYPNEPEKRYVKRVVGLPGETVAIRDGALYVNGRLLSERYVMRFYHGDYPATRVPAGRYFVLGDNRDHSSDSRTWGTLPAANIEGRVWLRFWPLDRVGVME